MDFFSLVLEHFDVVCKPDLKTVSRFAPVSFLGFPSPFTQAVTFCFLFLKFSHFFYCRVSLLLTKKNLVCSSQSISGRATVLLWLMEISVKENAGSFRQLRHVSNCILKLSPKFIVSSQKVLIKTCGNVQKCCLELLFLNIQLQKYTTK